MELEDSYGVAVSSEDETAKIVTVGDAVDFVYDRLGDECAMIIT